MNKRILCVLGLLLCIGLSACGKNDAALETASGNVVVGQGESLTESSQITEPDVEEALSEADASETTPKETPSLAQEESSVTKDPSEGGRTEYLQSLQIYKRFYEDYCKEHATEGNRYDCAAKYIYDENGKLLLAICDADDNADGKEAVFQLKVFRQTAGEVKGAFMLKDLKVPVKQQTGTAPEGSRKYSPEKGIGIANIGGSLYVIVYPYSENTDSSAGSKTPVIDAYLVEADTCKKINNEKKREWPYFDSLAQLELKDIPAALLFEILTNRLSLTMDFLDSEADLFAHGAGDASVPSGDEFSYWTNYLIDHPVDNTLELSICRGDYLRNREPSVDTYYYKDGFYYLYVSREAVADGRLQKIGSVGGTEIAPSICTVGDLAVYMSDYQMLSRNYTGYDKSWWDAGTAYKDSIKKVKPEKTSVPSEIVGHKVCNRESYQSVIDAVFDRIDIYPGSEQQTASSESGNETKPAQDDSGETEPDWSAEGPAEDVTNEVQNDAQLKELLRLTDPVDYDYTDGADCTELLHQICSGQNTILRMEAVSYPVEKQSLEAGPPTKIVTPEESLNWAAEYLYNMKTSAVESFKKDSMGKSSAEEFYQDGDSSGQFYEDGVYYGLQPSVSKPVYYCAITAAEKTGDVYSVDYIMGRYESSIKVNCTAELKKTEYEGQSYWTLLKIIEK